MNTIMFMKHTLLFCYFIQMIVAENVQDKKSLDRNMIPYKTVYGVPSKCKGTSDLQTTEENYRTCQMNAIEKWKIELQHYYTESWNFCCFVYDVLKCETKVLYECDADYSDSNDKETRRLFDKSCQPIMANKPCSKSEGGGGDWIWKGLGIAAGVGLFLGLLYDCINFWRNEYNPKLIAKEAYKAEKFRQKYEKEYIRAVYDHEVDIQDKQYFTNAPKQTSENGEAQPIKKQENVKIPQKDLKKIKKKINSQIETDSKNDPSFWDEFHEDPEKYYVQPTGVKAKAKKYFKRLWPFSKGNSEEQLKREELIRSEARRQYENIRKNRLELDKISTGNESSIEEINDDLLLAKTLRTLNQELVDVYRETIKTTDFPESGSMDQLEIYTKNFKDTRNRLRNEFDKKFETKFREESDNKLIKNRNWLKSSTHGSKTTEDESTKILRRNSYKDNKTQTPVSMIRRTESTSKPKGSQTNESLKKVGSQFKKQQSTSSVLSEQASLSKPGDVHSSMIPARDSSQDKKPQSTTINDEAIEKAEAEKKRKEDEARQQAEAEKKRKEDEAKKKAEAEKKRKEDEARQQAEAEKKRKEDEAKKKAEAEKKRKEDEARQQAEAEKKRKEDEAKKKAEAEKKRKEDEARQQAEAEKKRKEDEAEAEKKRKEDEARQQAEAEKKRKEDEAKAEKKRKEDEARQQAEAEKKRKEDEARQQAEAEKKRKEDETKKKAEAEKKRKEDEARQKAEAEKKRKEDEARQQAEAEKKRKEDEARQKAEAEKKRKEDEARQKAEAEKKRKEDEARQQAEAEKKRKEDEARQKAEAEKKRKEDEARQKAEAEKKRKEDEARQQAEAEKKRKEDEARQKAEAEKKRKEDEARQQAEAEKKRKEDEARQQAEAEKKRKEDEARQQAEAEKKRKEDEAKKKAEAEKKRKEDEARQQAEAEKKRKEDEAREIAEAEKKRKADKIRKALEEAKISSNDSPQDEKPEIQTNEHLTETENPQTDNVGAYAKKDSKNQLDENLRPEKKVYDEYQKLSRQHYEEYEIKKQNATSQEEIDALELERINTKPDLKFDDNSFPFIINKPMHSKLKQQQQQKFTESQTTEQYEKKAEKPEIQTNEHLTETENPQTDNVGAYAKKDSDDQYYDELFSEQKKLWKELAKLTKQHDEKYEIKKQNATTQEEIDALELERIDNRPEIMHDENLRPFLIENPKTSELKKQLLKRDEERTKARIREEYKRALKKWNKQYNEQKKRYNETRSDKDYRILKQLELNKPRLYDDEGNEIIDMTTPLQRQEQPTSQQQQRSRQQQQRQTILQQQQRSRQQQQRQTILQEQQRVCQNENEQVYINEAKRKRAEIKRIHAMNLKEWQKEYKALRKRFKETGSDEDYNNLEEWRFNKPFLPFDDDDDDDEIINMTQPLRPEMKRQKISLYKKIETKQKSKNISTTATTTTTEISEPENKIPIYSEIAEKIYENGIRYEYYDLKDKREEIYQYWETRLAKVEYLMERDADREEAANLGIEYDHCLACEHKRCEKEKKEELTEMDERIIKAKDIMKDDLKSKKKRINKQINRFGKDENKRKNTEKDIKKELFEKYKEQIEQFKSENAPEDEQKAKSGLGKKIKKLFRFGNKNEVDLEPLEYRIEPILTNEEKFIVSQAIDQSSEKNEYRSSILKEMIEFERLAKLDISKTKEAILFRDEYFKPLYQDIVDGNFQNDIYKFGLLMDGTYKYYIEKSINESKSEHKGYRAQIMNEINHFSATRNLSESDRKTLTKFLDIFKKRLSDEPDKPEYPISNFRRKVVLGQNPLISAEQEDFLYYASVIRPKIYNEPVDYYVWFLKELYATKGKYFYDPSHNRFSTLETGKTNMLLMNLALESYNNFQKKLPNPSPLLNIMLNTLEITAVPSEEKYSRYSGLPRTSTISSKSSNTGSLSKRMQRSVNQAILQTATQISGNQFTDYSQQL
ncbi:uncharacterized protein LOC142645600 [Dermatophagoides pteronyssinus]|uniref:uncharacterized protein LOC142645600 n=1 Tax=Dermatophagoides pteronyssinus TaxID=6956 RepID=UPI003F669810